MKKNYITPNLFICQVRVQQMISTSGQVTGTYMGFGEDADAGDIGAVKRNYNVWDDDWSE